MKKQIIHLIVALVCWNINAQTTFQGKVIDSVSKESLIYTHVYNASRGHGTLTNNSGDFEILANSNDTILVSYLGYKDRIFTAKDIENNEIELYPTSNRLSEITITAQRKDLYQILQDSKQLLIGSKETIAKAYYLVNSSEDNNPVEFTEIFYNAKIKNGSIENLSFKNGNSYLNANAQEDWFLNINMSQAFSMYNIIDTNRSLPQNPYQLSKRKLKRKYTLNELEHNTSFLKIEFTPKEINSNYCSGIIWLDSKDYSLVKLEIDGDNKNNFFQPIGITSIDKLDYTISYNYSKNLDAYRLSHVSVSYKCIVRNDTESRIIKTEAILHMTKYDEKYFTPRFEFVEGTSDYKLISLVPDTAIFNYLSKEGHIKLTKKQSANLAKLRANGQNFGNSEFGNEFFENNYVVWSEDRITMKKAKKKIKIEDVRSIEDRIDRYGFNADKLEIRPLIYIDFQQSDTGVIIETSSILDIYNSYNRLDDGVRLQTYLNIYFDLVEVYRRRFLNSINPQMSRIEDIEKAFNLLLLQLEEQQALLRDDSFAGQDIDKLSKWNDLIYSELGINNFALFGIMETEPASKNR